MRNIEKFGQKKDSSKSLPGPNEQIVVFCHFNKLLPDSKKENLL